MTDRSAAQRPPSLRDVLDAGCFLSEMGSLDALAEELYRELPFLPPKQRQSEALTARAVAEDLIARRERSQYAPVWADGSRGPGNFQQYLSSVLWRAEILEDEELAERLRRALPPEVTAHQRARSDLYRRPHPLEVRMPDTWWWCDNCGASFDQGEQEALVVTHREGYSALDYPISYCRACVTAAAEVVGQVNGS